MDMIEVRNGGSGEMEVDRTAWETGGLMTPPPGPDMPITPGQFKKTVKDTAWEFDFDFMLGRDATTQLTDEDTITSIASEETLC